MKEKCPKLFDLNPRDKGQIFKIDILFITNYFVKIKDLTLFSL